MPVSGSNGYRSGIVTLPNRVKLRQMDERAGLYPTISRTGDKDRGGNFNISAFNDNDTVVYQSVSNIMFGSMTITGSEESVQGYAGNNNPNGGISGAGRLISGISDNPYLTDYKELVSRKDSDIEPITFFDEGRINLIDSQFYLTGTSKSLFPGFGGRLHDKTQIVIDMTANETTYFGNTNKSNDSSSPYLYQSDTSDVKQPYMGYYNHILKRWESIGQGFGMNQTYGTEANLIDIVKKAQIGFDGCIAKIATGSDQAGNDYRLFNNDTLNSTMRPISTFGFPFDGRYHATGSQVIDMSQYINSPFIVEKVVFEFNALIETGDSTGTGDTDTNGYRLGAGYGDPLGIGNSTDSIFTNVEIRNYNFFLLRQFESKFEKSWEIITGSGSPTNESGFRYGKFTVTSSIPGTFGLGGDSSTITLVKDERELITYGQLIDYHVDASNPLTNGSGFTKQDVLNSPLISGRDAIFERETASFGQTSGSSLTGSFIIPCNVRHTAGILPANRMRVYTTKGTVTELALWMQNRYSSRGRDTLDKSARALVNGHGSVYKGATERLQPFSSTEEAFPITPSAAETLDDHSPYVLFPQDKIIIGFQYPPPENLKTAGGVFDDVRLNRMGFSGPGKVTLYGSQIRNKKEFHDTLNQNLTSEAVHEDIGYEDSICLDQFIINTRQEYSGSYLDDHITGSAGSIVRSLIGSGENNLSGSFQRFAKCNNQKERYYDTLVLEQISYASKFPENSVGNPFRTDNEIRIDNNIANEILMSFPFEPRFSSVSRTPDSGFENVRKGSLFVFSGFNNNSSFVNNDDRPVAVDITDTLNYIPDDLGKMNYILYGFGSGVSGKFNNSNRISGGSSYNIVERPRGWRYGLWNAFKETTSMTYRMDRYTGQYADIISQRYDTRFFDQETNTVSQGPINVQFVTKDEDGSGYQVLSNDQVLANTFESSNTDLYSTSSLPFFDEINNPRNRSYDNLINQTVEVS